MTASDEDHESWAEGLQHLAHLHMAMRAASAGTCGTIKQEMNALEHRLGITHEAAVAKGLLKAD